MQLWVINCISVSTDLTFTLGLREDGPIDVRVAFVLEGPGVSPTDIEVVLERSSVALAITAVGQIGRHLRCRRV
ncbi:MAG: hypothetical protein IT427_17605 [Pirellulales bacterium]|nr:hypothetical protein [Pirellulales bacterium]